MGSAFFPSHVLQSTHSVAGLLPKCEACLLYKGCKSPKMPVTGKGKRKILIIGEAPGAEEDENNRQFVGASGAELRSYLLRHDVNLREDCWATNALICRPPGNEIPKDKREKWINSCRPNLINTLNALKPEIIIPLGAVAVISLIKNYLMKDKKGTWSISKWAGLEIPCQQLNAWIVPNFHPSWVLREKNKALNLLFNRYLKAAASKKGRPWKTIPKFRKMVEVIQETDAAVKAIRSFRHEKLIAFDYETSSLKPDNPKVARILCCSISNGQRTIAYHWNKETRDATKKILENPKIKKTGANIPFETKWSMTCEGINVKGWVWDVVNNMHIQDCRQGISGVKFQAFSTLGQASWNDDVEPYIGAPSGNERNRLHKVEPYALLLYCGVDSLLEFIRTLQQMLWAGHKIPSGTWMDWQTYFN